MVRDDSRYAFEVLGRRTPKAMAWKQNETLKAAAEAPGKAAQADLVKWSGLAGEIANEQEAGGVSVNTEKELITTLKAAEVADQEAVAAAAAEDPPRAVESKSPNELALVEKKKVPGFKEPVVVIGPEL